MRPVSVPVKKKRVHYCAAHQKNLLHLHPVIYPHSQQSFFLFWFKTKGVFCRESREHRACREELEVMVAGQVPFLLIKKDW